MIFKIFIASKISERFLSFYVLYQCCIQWHAGFLFYVLFSLFFLFYLESIYFSSEIVTSRMLTTFDVPLLVIAIMELRPWIRSRPSAKCGWTTAGVAAAALEGAGDVQEIYDNGQWRIYSDDGDPSGAILHPVEAHLWLLLLSLVFHPVAPRKYDLTDHRCQQLLKVPTALHFLPRHVL